MRNIGDVVLRQSARAHGLEAPASAAAGSALHQTQREGAMVMEPATFKLPQRFWDKVNRGGDDECWNWIASVNARGYGQFRWQGKMRKAARLILESLGQLIKPDQVTRHSCDNRRCVNPSHLSTGTAADNVRDRVERGRSNRPIGERNGRAVATAAHM
jgi:hypothetical protein